MMQIRFRHGVGVVVLAASVLADDAPHWIGLDDTLRNADVVASASAVASTAIDARTTSSAASGARRITGRPFRGMTIYFR